MAELSLEDLRRLREALVEHTITPTNGMYYFALDSTAKAKRTRDWFMYGKQVNAYPRYKPVQVSSS